MFDPVLMATKELKTKAKNIPTKANGLTKIKY